MLQAERQAAERIGRLEQAIRDAVANWSLSSIVPALMAMRGIDLVSSVTILAEIGDLSRFENPRQLMAYLGLVARSVRPATASSAAALPRPAMGAPGACWSRLPGPIAILPVSDTKNRRWSRPPHDPRVRLPGRHRSGSASASAHCRGPAKNQQWSRPRSHASWRRSSGPLRARCETGRQHARPEPNETVTNNRRQCIWPAMGRPAAIFEVSADRPTALVGDQ